MMQHYSEEAGSSFLSPWQWGCWWLSARKHGNNWKDNQLVVAWEAWQSHVGRARLKKIPVLTACHPFVRTSTLARAARMRRPCIDWFWPGMFLQCSTSSVLYCAQLQYYEDSWHFQCTLDYFDVSIIHRTLTKTLTRIFNVRMWPFCMRIHTDDLALLSHPKDYCWVCTEFDSGKTSGGCKAQHVTITHPSADDHPSSADGRPSICWRPPVHLLTITRHLLTATHPSADGHAPSCLTWTLESFAPLTLLSALCKDSERKWRTFGVRSAPRTFEGDKAMCTLNLSSGKCLVQNGERIILALHI